MLLLEEYISNFTCIRYYFLYVEFSDFYVNQSLAGQTVHGVYKGLSEREEKSRGCHLKKIGDDVIAQNG
jgi:hypothetical protein